MQERADKTIPHEGGLGQNVTSDEGREEESGDKTRREHVEK